MLILSLLFYPVLANPVYKQTIRNAEYGYEGEYVLESGTGPYGDDSKKMNIKIFLETKKRLHIQIYDPTKTYYEHPDVIMQKEVTKAEPNPEYFLSFNNNGIQVTRKSSNEVIFDSSNPSRPLLFEDAMIQLATKAPQSPIVSGLFERRTRFQLPLPFNYSCVNAARGTPNDGQALYGTHPFYIDTRTNGNTHGVLFYNSFPMEIELNHNFISHRAMGGKLDFYIFLGPTPIDCVQQYTDLIGKPCLVPQWTMGFHNCRWGYKNLAEVESVVNSYLSNNMPIDAVWYDIDYLNEKRIFETDPINYPMTQMKTLIERYRTQHGIHTVTIIDPGIKIDPAYQAYNDLLKSGMYLRTPRGDAFEGKVWPGPTIFPDFSHDDINSFWLKYYRPFLQSLPVDGIWDDMNEISNFCDGYCNDTKAEPHKWEPINLNKHSCPSDLVTSKGPWLDLHNLYSNQENKATAIALKERYPGKRHFILSRSSWIGAGRTNTVWLGDNKCTWLDLYDSIAMVFASGIAGIPYVGADIGGFTGTDATAELVTRWVQLGSFTYPFYRNHGSNKITGHEWYKFGEPYTAINREFMYHRQSLTSTFYSLMHQSHIDGTPIVVPQSFVFPTDSNTYGNDKQAMLGNILLCTPVLTEGATSVAGYFPLERWYSFYTDVEDAAVSMKGKQVTVSAPLSTCPAHFKGGSIVTRQRTRALSIQKMKDSPIFVTAFMSKDNTAEGFLFVDDGVSDNDTAVSTIRYTATKNQMNVRVEKKNYATNQVVEGFKIVGLKAASIRGVTIKPETARYTFNYNAQTGTLQIGSTSGGWNVTQEMTITWSE
ncbi:putative Lysosomal alpha-glucosidase [Blattamonas nauphoetae]|uniref:Maltase n=1 Tax=Blattamonas nauphoetae TaxID=2049346 RepID=A0ABQ9YJ49_9EUKA|nr:putative Lysosomal alpha-glucosidase [Blattamonas nauphoetae]